MTPPASIFDLSFEQLVQQCDGWGQPAFRAKQIWRGVYQRLAAEIDALTDLPIELRRRISEQYALSTLIVSSHERTHDGSSEKTLFSLHDGQKVEAVLMHYDRRSTACISTQVGCAMGCVFCATGQMGYERNLSSGEIVEQVVHFARQLSAREKRLTNIVVMGMGEPFHNYDATMDAAVRLNHPAGFKFGARRITISTVGLVPAIERFTQDGWQFNLAVSLHAATNALRSRLLPVNRRFPLERLIPACREYVQRSGRRITFEWALIRNLNDGTDQAEALSRLVQGINCHVNLIPLNPTPNYAGDPASNEAADNFCQRLSAHGVSCSVRMRRGIDIQAGCGQLAIENR